MEKIGTKTVERLTLQELIKMEQAKLKDADLVHIESRLLKATEGPWKVRKCNSKYEPSGLGGPVVKMWDDELVEVGTVSDNGPTAPVMDDAEFIAHAWTDIRMLLDEVKRLRALIVK